MLVIEDGPTLTHGEMAYGAGWVAAQRFGAAEIIDPRPYAVGSIKATYEKYPTTGNSSRDGLRRYSRPASWRRPSMPSIATW